MPTKPLGRGTCNLSVNVRVSLRRSLGRLAFKRDVSMGELVRRMIGRAAHVWAAFRFAATAEQADLEAVNVLRTAIADGVGPEDQEAIECAIALIVKSAEADRVLRIGLNLQQTAVPA